MSRFDYARIPELHAAARRHRAQVIGQLFALGFAWLLTRGKHASRVPQGRTLARGW